MDTNCWVGCWLLYYMGDFSINYIIIIIIIIIIYFVKVFEKHLAMLLKIPKKFRLQESRIKP